MGTALACAHAGEGGSRSGTVVDRYAAARPLCGPAQGALRGAVRGPWPSPALHAAEEDRGVTLSSEPRLSRTDMRAGAAGRLGSLVAGRRELRRGSENGAGDRGAQGVYPRLSELVRPLSVRPHRTGRWTTSKSPARALTTMGAS